MKDGRLTREQVVPLLDTDDADLQQAALAVMGRRPDVVGRGGRAAQGVALGGPLDPAAGALADGGACWR